MHAVDLYCERLEPGFWGEPLNALSNLAFLLGALVLWRARASSLPAVLLGCVGAGSFVFHTWATQLTMILDILPILVLIAWAGREAFFRHLYWRWTQVLGLALVVTLPALPLWFWVSDPAASGIAYVPAGLALWIVWTRFHARGHHGAPWLLLASLAFSFAYTARALDPVLCDGLPMGTHWMWHLLNALAMTALIWGLTPEAQLRPPQPSGAQGA